MSAEPNAPEIMPVDWRGPFHGLRVALSLVDEFDFPAERRGLMTKLPSDPAEYKAFADTVAKTVRDTVLFILNDQKDHLK